MNTTTSGSGAAQAPIDALVIGELVMWKKHQYIVMQPPMQSRHMGRLRAVATGMSEIISHDLQSRRNFEVLPPDPELSRRFLTLLGAEFSTTSGTDPECFIADGDGNVIPAWRFLPHERDASDDGIAMRSVRAYWDGWQAEISNIPGSHPHYCHEKVVEDVRSGLWGVLQAARAFNPAASLLIQDVVPVSPADLESAPDELVQLGCAPSCSAYGANPVQGIDGRTLPIRFAGCHLHVAVAAPPPAWFPNGTIVMMDKVAGVMLTALGRGLEDWRRRQFYGRPGEFRVPKAPAAQPRLEYRTPGSFLLRHPAAFHFGLDVTRCAMRMGMLTDGRSFDLPDVQDIITQCDADAAWKVIHQHRTFFTSVLGAVYGETNVTLPAMFNTLRRGLAATVPVDTPEDAWGLPGLIDSDGARAEWIKDNWKVTHRKA